MNVEYLKYLLTLSFLLLFSTASSSIDFDFSHKRGLYSVGFSLNILVDDPSAVIYYTTDGSDPSPSNGSTYSNPISISSTTILKTIAIGNSQMSGVKVHSYIFPADVVNQPASISGFPSANYNLDSSIKNDPVYGNQLVDGLQQIPTVSIVMDIDTLNSLHDVLIASGTSNEHKFSFEFIDIDGDYVQEYAGIERAGGSSFYSNKRNMRITFKDKYGAGKLDYPVFGKNATDEIDQIALRPGFHGCMQLGIGHIRAGSNDLADEVVRRFQINMSEEGYGLSGIFAHLYLNGIYWGVYNLTERANDGYCESYFGGDQSDYDVVKRKLAASGNLTAWNQLNNLADNTNLANNNNYQNIQSYVDIDNFADYVILCNYAPHADDHLNGKNSFVTRDRTKNKGFKFWIWDTEPALGHYWTWYVEPFGSSPYNNIFLSLTDNADFRMLVSDKIECNCFNDGPLDVSKSTQTYLDLYSSLDKAMLLESARWQTKSEYTEFVNTKNRIVNNYLPTRPDYIKELYRTNGVYPSIEPVDFNLNSGIVAAGTQIQLTNPNSSGSIYYTIDGSDPRASGGSISSSAMTYSNSINLSTGVYEIKARVKNGSVWSAMCPNNYYVSQNYQDLVINEIHYNPNDSIFFNPQISTMDTVSGRNFEFIEIKNSGSSIVHLKDVHFSKGVTAKLDETLSIQPNGFIVLAEDTYWFEEKYGFAPDGSYAGKLDNGGESIWLMDPMENIVDSLAYDDNLPWDTIPDNGTYSLALIEETLDNALPASWVAQIVAVTPNAENQFCSPFTFNSTISNPQCFGIDNGSATVTTTGGSGPYSYAWSHGPIGNTANGLAAGTYSVTVIDSYGCPDTELVTIQSPPTEIMVITSKTNPLCYGINDGTASATAIGGNGDYSYTWSNGASTASISNLTPGTYTVTVEDVNGCQKIQSVNIASPPSALSIDMSSTNPICAGINNGSASASGVGGSGGYNYSWSNGSSTTSINNLSPGNYSLTLTDSNGCSITESLSISPASNTLSILSSVTDPSVLGASDGSISLTTLGPSATSWTWSNGALGSSINGLSPGAYTVNVEDVNGCTTSHTAIVSPGPQLPVAAATFTPNNGVAPINISFNALGSNDPDGFIVGYNWDFGDGNLGSGANPTHNYTNPGTYLVTLVITDSQGLTDTISLSVNVIDTCDPPANLNLITASANTLIVTWIGDPEATSYNLRYRDATVGGSWNNFSTTGTTAIITGLNTCTDYEVKVNNQCTFNLQSAYSATEVYSTTNCFICNAPSGLYQFNVQNISAIITWDVLVGATSYTYKFRKVGDPNWISETTTFPIAVLFGISGCTDYEWTMETTCYDGSTAQSSTINYFNTLCKKDITELVQSKISELIIYPNPTYSNVNIVSPSDLDEDQLILTNALGEIILVQNLNKPHSGNTINVDLSLLSPGVYSVSIGEKTSSFIKR